jgi:hypothetical protein
MRKFLRVLVAIFLLPAILLAAVYYSSSTSIYECVGTVTKASNTSAPGTLFAKITLYRPWAYWMNPIDGVLRLEHSNGTFPTIPGDDPGANRLIRTGSGLYTAPYFPGLVMSSGKAREDLFIARSADTFLNLFRWPKAGETLDLTKSTQGRFSKVSNSLSIDLGDEKIFNGTCKPKDN